MIVVDASALAELLLQTPLGERVERRVVATPATLHVPHLVDAEITQVLRRLVRTGALSTGRAESALADLAAMRIRRHGHLHLLARVWQLRHNVTVYDALYVALAEALDAPLVTCDGPLSEVPGHRARIELVR